MDVLLCVHICVGISYKCVRAIEPQANFLCDFYLGFVVGYTRIVRARGWFFVVICQDPFFKYVLGSERWIGAQSHTCMYDEDTHIFTHLKIATGCYYSYIETRHKMCEHCSGWMSRMFQCVVARTSSSLRDEQIAYYIG